MPLRRLRFVETLKMQNGAIREKPRIATRDLQIYSLMFFNNLKI